MSQFDDNLKFGLQFEDETFELLDRLLTGYTVTRVIDELGEGVYKKDKRKYPDFTVRKDGKIVQFFDAKIKKGKKDKFDDTKINVSVDETFIESYRYFSKLENAPAHIILHCSTNMGMYMIDVNNLPKHRVNKGAPKHGSAAVYWFNTDDLEEF